MGALDQIDTWPPATVAAGWLRADGQSECHGPVETTFELASITKALFAYAVLIAVEEGTLELDRPLTGIATADSGTGTTAEVRGEALNVRSLLSHASGLPFESEFAPELTPRQHLNKRRIYSNVGFDLLANILAKESGLTANEYWAEAVAHPLGMSQSTIPGSVAHSGESTVIDLLKFCRELLSPSLISAETLADATRPQDPDLVGTLPGFGHQAPNPWGLGFEIRGQKSPHWTGTTNSPQTFGHFGAKGTMFWVDPTNGIAAVCLADLAFGPWAATCWPVLSDGIIASN